MKTCPEDCPAAFDPTCKDHRPKVPKVAVSSQQKALGLDLARAIYRRYKHDRNTRAIAGQCANILELMERGLGDDMTEEEFVAWMELGTDGGPEA